MGKYTTLLNTVRNQLARKTASFNSILLIWMLLLPMFPISKLNAQTGDDFKKKGPQQTSSLSSKQIRSAKTSPELIEFASRISGKGTGAQNAGNLSQATSGGTIYTFANVEFTTSKARKAIFPSNNVSRIKGISVLTVIGRFADIYISSDIFDATLKKLEEAPGILWIDGVRNVIVPPTPPYTSAKIPSKAVPDRIIRNGYRNFKGKNVIIAIVDSGVDFRHPDFIAYDSSGRPSSRLLYLWDTGLEYQSGRGNPAPFTYPNKASIGTLFTQGQLTAELRSSTQSIPANDLEGHGTACASIAAGNGNADMGDTGLKRGEVVGVAPEADIIGISLDTYKNRGLSGAYLLNAISAWLDKVSGAKPLVVSNSWGQHREGHDGQTIFERQLNARFPLDKTGRAIVFAAGNEGEYDFHATMQISGKRQVLAEWATSYSPLRAYFSTNDIGDIEFRSSKGMVLKFAYRYPITNQVVAVFKVSRGFGGVYFSSRTGKSIRADLYLPQDPDSVFRPAVRNRQGMIASPGTMRNAITVGSYDWNDSFNIEGRVAVLKGSCIALNATMVIGGISCYSSQGLTRDGRVKPEIVSPGQYFTSSHAKVEGMPVSPKYADTTGNYMLMNGTSAATPYTAGIVALMFEKKPTLTLREVKRLLMTNASRDPFTGVPPGKAWGSGKLDMRAVARIFAAIR